MAIKMTILTLPVVLDVPLVFMAIVTEDKVDPPEEWGK
jgi:hypothetical protein